MRIDNDLYRQVAHEVCFEILDLTLLDSEKLSHLPKWRIIFLEELRASAEKKLSTLNKEEREIKGLEDTNRNFIVREKVKDGNIRKF